MSDPFEPCPECNGTGLVEGLTCSDCDGTGEIEVEHESDEEDE